MSDSSPLAPLTVHPVSLDLAFRDANANLASIERAIAEDATKTDHSIFVFPELTLTGFVTLNPDLVSVSLESPPLLRLCEVAKRYGVAIVAGLIESPARAGGKPRNTTVFVSRDGAILARYRKIHLFTKGRPSEADTFEAGTEPCLFDYLGVRIALGVCFDIRFPALFQHYAEQKADLMIVIACWVGGENKSMQFRTLTRGHAITSRAYVVAVNRVGKDPYFNYEGENLAYDPAGVELNERPVRIDPARIETVRTYVEIDYSRAYRENR